MTRKKHPAIKMALREAYDTYYDKSELQENSIRQCGYNLARWEALTDNPPIEKIDEAALEAFRKKALETCSPSSVNCTRTAIRAILRRLGPQETGNPMGMGVLERVPHMKHTRVERDIPRRIDQEDLSKWYVAATLSKLPRWGGPAGWWWQAWITVAYFCGLRKGDIFNIKFSDVDYAKSTLLVKARKTQKPIRMPLHPIVLEHIKRIERPIEYVFACPFKGSGNFNGHWRRICDRACLPERFTPHDVRRTAGSEIERVKAGMGAVLLQHSQPDVTHVSYLNQMEELAESIAKMRVPIAFAHGIRQAERQAVKARTTNAELMKAARLSPPGFPDVAEWQFHDCGFLFRGIHVKMQGSALRILKAMVFSTSHTCDLESLCVACWPDGHRPPTYATTQGTICDRITTIRQRLRHALLLPADYNCVPCIERGHGGRWTLYIPSQTVQGVPA